MKRLLVAVINRAQAQLFTLEPREDIVAKSPSHLVEKALLENPVGATAGEELWANIKTGLNRGSGGPAHSYDDHRDKHVAEFERRFAQTIATQIGHWLRAEDIHRLLIIAEPQILGILRKSLTEAIPSTVQVNDLAKNLSSLSSHELHSYLLQQQLVL